MNNMTKENKELLLQDLCARLSCGVIVRHADYLIDSDGNYTGQFLYKQGYLYDICRMDSMTTTIIESEGSDEEGYEHICDLERSLPYLRPISSMTNEERKELQKITNNTFYASSNYISNSSTPLYGECHVSYNSFVTNAICNKLISWLDKNHFDHRTDEEGKTLIEKGLAIAVTKENNPYE